MKNNTKVKILLGKAKKLAREYYRLTQKPLGITGEVAEYEASKLLGVKLTPARNDGYDAIECIGKRKKRLQIKGRRLQKYPKPGQRIGSININKKWDAVLMVLLDDNFNAIEIHEAPRAKIIKALKEPGSKARNERGALGVSQFKRIGKQRWPK